jgi:predicted nucleic acid-binding protein
MAAALRVCLDLNIWCAALLADRKGRQNTASQSLVAMVRQGFCLSSPVQLVISWGMLNRLLKVLVQDLKVSTQTAELYISTIAAYARLGAMGASPQLTLGGMGVIPLRDTEDAYVMETADSWCAAIAGRANILITANFKDFISKDTQVVIPGKHAVYRSPDDHTFQVVHPYLMMDWLRSGQIPSISSGSIF